MALDRHEDHEVIDAEIVEDDTSMAIESALDQIDKARLCLGIE